ncbi:MAG TPA: hypothetical protein VF158_14535 [Longimicrobiales bacterium]
MRGPTTGVTAESKGDVLELSAKGRIRTLRELLEAAEVDLSEWTVERWKANAWETAGRGPDGELVTETLHQVTAHLRPAHATDEGRLRVIADEAIALMRAEAPAPLARELPPTDGLMLELSVPDLHVGKLATAETSGEPYDLDAAEAAYRRAVEALVAKARPLQPERVLMVVGNDLLHVDGPSNATTKGTPQDVAGTWRQAFRRALALTQWAVRAALELGPVHVLTVPGNHAATLEEVLGEALAAGFYGDDRVTFDVSARPRKYIEHGSVLLGFTHGHNEAPGDLPSIMAAEVPEAWGRTSVREWHTGHLHQRRARRRVFDVDELAERHGVVVRILPALCPADEWHARRGFVGNLRAAEAYLWSHDGLEAMLTGRP